MTQQAPHSRVCSSSTASSTLLWFRVWLACTPSRNCSFLENGGYRATVNGAMQASVKAASDAQARAAAASDSAAAKAKAGAAAASDGLRAVRQRRCGTAVGCGRRRHGVKKAVIVKGHVEGSAESCPSSRDLERGPIRSSSSAYAVRRRIQRRQGYLRLPLDIRGSKCLRGRHLGGRYQDHSHRRFSRPRLGKCCEGRNVVPCSMPASSRAS